MELELDFANAQAPNIHPGPDPPPFHWQSIGFFPYMNMVMIYVITFVFILSVLRIEYI